MILGQKEPLDLGILKVHEYTPELGDTEIGISLVEVVESLGEHYNRTSRMHYLVVSSDGGAFTVAGERQEVRSGDVVVIDPGTRYAVDGYVKAYSVSIPPYNASDSVFEE